MILRIFNIPGAGLILFLILGLVAPAMASTPQETITLDTPPAVTLSRTYDLHSTLQFSGESTRSQQQTQQSTALKLDLWGQAEWSQNLSGLYQFSLRAQSVAEAQSGSNDRPRRSDSSFKFNFIDFRPIYNLNRLQLSGVVVSQKQAGLSEFWDDRGALALFQNFSVFSSPMGQVSLSAYQGQFLAYDGLVGASSLPQLFSFSLDGEYKSKSGTTQLRLTPYRLRNVDGEMADVSRDYGNDVVGLDSESARFSHTFRGYFLKLNQTWVRALGRADLTVGGEYSQNTAGRSGTRESVIYKAQFQWPEYRWEARYFEVGEQAVPAALLKSPWNRVNVEGQSLQGQLEWQGFLVSATWIRLDPIFKKYASPKEQILFLQLEKSFELL